MIKRMKSKRNWYAIGWLAALSLFGGISWPATAYASETKTIQIEKTYESTDPEESGESYFGTTYEKDGVIYGLSEIRTEIVDTKDVDGTPYIYDSAVFVDEPENHPPETEVEREGGTYILKNAELREGTLKERTKYVESTVKYSVEYIDEIPERSKVEVVDEDTGQKTTHNLPLIHATRSNEHWDNNFTFPITVYDYDAELFMLGNDTVRRGEDLMDYRSSLLAYLGLPEQYYKIAAIGWTGEPYEKEGKMVRNATATGYKLVTDLSALYGGTVTLPALEGHYYHCTYLKQGAEEGKIYTVKAVATYREETASAEQNKSFWEWLLDLLKWLLSHPILTISVFLLLCILLAIIILFVLAQKKEDEEPEIEIIDLSEEDDAEDED